MDPQGKTFKTDQEMLAPAFKRKHLFPGQTGLIDFAIACNRYDFLAGKLLDLFFKDDDAGAFWHGVYVTFVDRVQCAKLGFNRLYDGPMIRFLRFVPSGKHLKPFAIGLNRSSQQNYCARLQSDPPDDIG